MKNKKALPNLKTAHLCVKHLRSPNYWYYGRFYRSVVLALNRQFDPKKVLKNLLLLYEKDEYVYCPKMFI